MALSLTTSPVSTLASWNFDGTATGTSWPDSRRSSAETTSLREPLRQTPSTIASMSVVPVAASSALGSSPSVWTVPACSSAIRGGFGRAGGFSQPSWPAGMISSSSGWSANRTSTSARLPSEGGVRWAPPRTRTEAPGAESV